MASPVARPELLRANRIAARCGDPACRDSAQQRLVRSIPEVPHDLARAPPAATRFPGDGGRAAPKDARHGPLAAPARRGRGTGVHVDPLLGSGSTAPGQGHERSPVLLVHGYAGTEHIFSPLRAALTDAGFGCLVALRYNAFRTDIQQVADWLVDHAHRFMDANGSATVHLVGHSLGGLVVRHAVARRGLAGLASTVVTIATPHAGAPLARFVPGPAARQMRPGSDFLAALGGDRADHRPRWIDIQGDEDRVVPASSSAFGARSAVVTVRQPATGHGSVARHPEVISYIVSELLGAERQAGKSFSLAA